MAEISIGNIKIHMEIPVLFLFYAFTVSDSVKTNLIIYRTCYVTLNYNQSECALLGTRNTTDETKHLEEIVQPYANIIGMTYLIVEAIFTGIVCLFVGPWSDKFGRRFIIIVPLIGFTLSYIVTSIFAACENLSPWYSLLAMIPIILSGGFSTYLTASLSYISDVTTEENRGMRIGVFEGILSLGLFIGNLTSAYVYNAVGYSIIFLISALCCFIAAFFTYLFVPESIRQTELPREALYVLFDTKNIRDVIHTTFRKRLKYDRAVVLLCIFMLVLYVVVNFGEGGVAFLYLREKIHWSLESYTMYRSASNITWIVGSLVGVYYLHKVLKVPETILMLIGFISLLNGALLLGLANDALVLYLKTGVTGLGAVLSPMMRSLVSKIVPNEEIGKIFSVIVTFESIFGMVGSAFYTEIYNATITKNPSIFAFVSAGAYTIEIILALVVIYLRSRQKMDRELLVNATEDNEEE